MFIPYALLVLSLSKDAQCFSQIYNLLSTVAYSSIIAEATLAQLNLKTEARTSSADGACGREINVSIPSASDREEPLLTT